MEGCAMGQVLHGSATTTEAIRRAIQHSQASLRALARRYGINPKTVQRGTGRSKSVVWRWQERFMQEGVDGLLRDKTRPPSRKPLDAAVIERVVGLTAPDPPAEATHWTAAMMAKTIGISVSSVQRIWQGHGLQPHRVRRFKLSEGPGVRPQAARNRRALRQSAGPRDRALDRREEPNPGARPHPARAA